MPKNIAVRLTREQTYSHLFTLCQNDDLFTIINYPDGWREEDWGRIVISDAKAIRPEKAAIGTVRLLPCDSWTIVMFVNKDAISHKKITKADEKLFEEYVERVISHFTDLSLLIGNSSEVAQKQSTEGHELSQSSINQVILNGNIIGSNVIVGNNNEASNSPDEIQRRQSKGNKAQELEVNNNANASVSPMHSKVVNWQCNVSQLYYAHVPHLATLAADAGLEIRWPVAKGVTSLHSLGIQLGPMMLACKELLKTIRLQVLPIQQIKKAEGDLIGIRSFFDETFRIKNVLGPDQYSSGKYRLTGDMKRDPHIYFRKTSGKGLFELVLPLDPRWITTDTSFHVFRSGQERFAGLCTIKSVKPELNTIYATPLVIGTPRTIYDSFG